MSTEIKLDLREAPVGFDCVFDGGKFFPLHNGGRLAEITALSETLQHASPERVHDILHNRSIAVIMTKTAEGYALHTEEVAQIFCGTLEEWIANAPLDEKPHREDIARQIRLSNRTITLHKVQSLPIQMMDYEDLVIICTPDTDLSLLFHLKNLDSLVLRSKKGVITCDISNLPPVKCLKMFGMHLTASLAPDQLASVENLCLDHNTFLTFPNSIGTMPNLRALSVRSLNDSRSPSWIKNAPALDSLEFSCGEELTTIPDWVTQFEKLSSLSVEGYESSSPVVDVTQALLKLPCLQDLNLRKVRLADTLESPGTMRQLSALTLEWCDLNSVPILFRHSPLTKLQLRYNEKIKELPDWIGKIKQLEAIIVHANRDFFFPQSVRQLTNLKKLTLVIYYIEESSLNEHIPFAALEELSFSNMRIETLPPWVTQARKLRSLDVACTKLSHLPEEIGELGDLRELALSYNPLKTLPQSLSKLTQLQRIEIADLCDLPAAFPVLFSLPQQCDIFFGLSTIKLSKDNYLALESRVNADDYAGPNINLDMFDIIAPEEADLVSPPPPPLNAAGPSA